MEDNKETKVEEVINTDKDNNIDDSINNKTNKKTIYIILVITAFLLVCLIIFCNYYNSLTFYKGNSNNDNVTDNTSEDDTIINTDKDEDKNIEKEETSKTDNTEKKEYDEPVDLAKCTFEFTMAEYNNYSPKDRYGETCYKTYKYIINDVVVDGVKLNVEILDGQAGVIPESDSGLYINGTKVESLYSGYMLDVESLSVHNNMLFAHIDGGTYINGVTNYLVFDKNGNKIYDLDATLSKLKLADPNANPKDKYSTLVSTGTIHRSSTKVVDGMLAFTTVTYSSDCPENGNCGSDFYIPFTEGKFETPIYVGGHKGGDDFLSKKIS